MAGPAFAVEVTTCGQAVPDGETGVLAGDLDCSAYAGGFAVVLEKGATLDLQGHTLTGPSNSSFDASVRCDAGEPNCHYSSCSDNVCRHSGTPCTVTSSTTTGVISGSRGIDADRNLIASNLLIQTTEEGIWLGAFGLLEATNVEISSEESYGIYGHAFSICYHLVGARLKLATVKVHDAGGQGITALAVKGSNVQVDDNGMGGILALKVKITKLHATGNGLADEEFGTGGVLAHKISLRESTVTENTAQGLPMDIGSGANVFDFYGSSFGQPHIKDTVCGASAIYDGAPPHDTWGICAND